MPTEGGVGYWANSITSAKKCSFIYLILFFHSGYSFLQHGTCLFLRTSTVHSDYLSVQRTHAGILRFLAGGILHYYILADRRLRGEREGGQKPWVSKSKGHRNLTLPCLCQYSSKPSLPQQMQMGSFSQSPQSNQRVYFVKQEHFRMKRNLFLKRISFIVSCN